jgi:hypothetical protein
MREIVRENFTSAIGSVPAADLPGSVSVIGAAKRIMPQIVVEANRSLAQVISQDVAWSVVGDALRTIADAAMEKSERLIYDLVYDGVQRKFVFTVWIGHRGADRTQSVFFAPVMGNVSEMRMTKDYTAEATWVHVGGDGQASLKIVSAVVAGEGIFASTPFYPTEAYVDVADAKNDQALMTTKGNQEMRRRAPRWVFSATALDIAEQRFGLHYDYGDLVSASHRGEYSVCRINQFRIRYAGGIEEIEIPLESEEIL